MLCLGSMSILYKCASSVASFLVPRPAFSHLQCGKAGRAWYISSREHDVVNKFSEQGRYVLRIIQPSAHSTLSEYDSRPPLTRYVWYVTWYLRSSCCSETQYAHVHLSLSTAFLPLTVTHVRKCTRPSLLFRTASNEKLGMGLGARLHVQSHISTLS